jgi:hypothetical protein
MSWLKVGILGLSVLFGMTERVRASIEFDNGDPVEQNLGLRFNYSIYTVFDNFFLNSDTTVKGFRWSQFDEANVSYAGSTLMLFNGLPTPSSLILSLDVDAFRSANGLMLSTDSLPLDSDYVFGFDYLVSDLSISLPSGTYWLGIHNDVSSGATLWANSSGTSDSISTSYQHVGISTPPLFGLTESGPADLSYGEFAFKVLSSTPPPPGEVPEPAAIVVWSLLGFVGPVLAWRRSRRRP